MGNNNKYYLVKQALVYFNEFIDKHSDSFIFHNQAFINSNVLLFNENAKGEGFGKDEYSPALVALILSDLGIPFTKDPEINNAVLINRFFEANPVNENEIREIKNYIDFLQTNSAPQTLLQEILHDSKYSYLAVPDTLERLELMRIEEEKIFDKLYTELEWLEKCKLTFITHTFDTPYSNRKIGEIRSRNFSELEKRIDKLRLDVNKEKKTEKDSENLSDKEGEDLFKIAFRNSVNLIAVADRKAGMLIQINTLLAGFVFTFGLNKFEVNPYYLIPTSIILLGSALTVYFGIMASKPIKRSFYKEEYSERENFFFGSFDKLDPEFRHVSWEKYSTDINVLLKGNKKYIFDQLIKESFQLRKVLSKKFNFLSLAYKVFFIGLILGIIGFLALLIFEYNFSNLPGNTIINNIPF